MTQLSVIIPTYNEECYIPKILSLLSDRPEIEVLVIDGGSRDNTVSLARDMGVEVFVVEGGRAQQINFGVERARSNRLLFLHADTILPINFLNLISETLSHANVVAGAFCLRINSVRPVFRVIEWGVQLRSRYLKMPYGDQGIFCHREAIEEIGGIPTLLIMEDYELMRRLRVLGKVEIIEEFAVTSPRRWEKLGVVKTTIINQLMIMGYNAGISTKWLGQFYRKCK